jgi:short subunit dehydrogenase-like uncharacterized protein
VSERPHDIVLFGATGFTGALTAEYLATHAAAGTRWALAGRNGARLEALRTRLSALDPGCAEMPLLSADLADPASVRAVAASTRVAISTAGPYLVHGESLVAACAETGTDYADLTGEPEFVDRMYVRYHERASRTGARLVHCCGFDSIPYDLGAYFTVRRLPEGVPVRLDAYARVGLGSGLANAFSAGSIRTALVMFSRRRQRLRASVARREMEPPGARRVGIRLMTPGYQRASHTWILPVRTVDSDVVCRSAAAIDRYGPDFSYAQCIAFDRLSAAVRVACAVPTVALLARFEPTRALLLGRVTPGTGPSREQRAHRWFQLRFQAEGGGQRVVSEVSGGDPGYGESAKMLAESALCLAHDELTPAAGQLTPAVAMGERLIERLSRSGISFRLLQAPSGEDPLRVA